jgi:glyoxylase-like metal-dependent hydrolase (beta-lactamase superfamily II)/8-oxo-dGTP pyrophosphatase MutT (NUDIX family)
MSRIFDAVTAILLHGPDLFITRRQVHLPAFPGYWAFPGGKVDTGDSDAPLQHSLLQGHDPKLMRALDRELREELEFDLFAAIERGEVQSLHEVGEATTPSIVPVRFRTHFYRIELTTRPPINAHEGETAEWAWLPAQVLRERMDRGRLLAAPPTRIAVNHIADWPTDTGAIRGFEFRFDPASEIPWMEPMAGLRMFAVQSNTIPPADRTNAFLLGDAGARQVLVDPSPASREELARFDTLLDTLSVDEVFLTHHHPDHREYADTIARRLRIPMGMSADTHQRIGKRSPGFFEGIETKIYREGDVLTQWQGEDVRVYAVPGHDEGQLALMPDSRLWCIVSDLIQGIGTVVVGGPEGNMRKYFESLQRVIDWNPDVIIPSHGIALGTTYRIKETLKHRQQREQQIAALHAEGKTPQEMLPAIYHGLDPRLTPLALININSHLQKLREENRIH